MLYLPKRERLSTRCVGVGDDEVGWKYHRDIGDTS